MSLHGEIRGPKALRHLVLLGMLVSGCAAPPLFPPEVSDTVDRALTFATLTTNPNAYKGRNIELGGQIVEARADQGALRLLVRELAIQTDPVYGYGPVDTGGSRGMFAVVYAGKVTAQDLQHGNLVVVATVMGAVVDTITGAPVPRLTLRAECLHIWRTGGHRIDEFPWPPSLQGYWPLIHATFCVNRPNTLLTVS
jgi:starvation-inducible outer membrane lipoprotein